MIIGENIHTMMTNDVFLRSVRTIPIGILSANLTSVSIYFNDFLHFRVLLFFIFTVIKVYQFFRNLSSIFSRFFQKILQKFYGIFWKKFQEKIRRITSNFSHEKWATFVAHFVICRKSMRQPTLSKR